MKKLLLLASVVLAFTCPAFAQDGQLGVAPSFAQYYEKTVTVTANAWVPIYGPSVNQVSKIIIGDTVGLGCYFSLKSNPIINEGIPFSVVGAPGSYVFDNPIPTNLISVYCSNSGTITVASA